MHKPGKIASAFGAFFSLKNDLKSKSENYQKKNDSVSRPDLDNLLEGFQIIGFDWKYLYLNNVAEAQSRLNNQKLIGRRFTEVWPGIEDTELYRHLNDCMTKRVPHHFNNEFKYPDGTAGWFELRIQPCQEGVLILSIDRTENLLAEKEKKLSEAALLANEEKYRYMFENNPQPMWIYDLETLAFLEVNDAAVSVYGYSKEEFLSMTLKDIRPVEDIPALLKNVEETTKTFNPAGEWRHLTKNKDLRIVEIISHSVNFNYRPARHVVINDLTDRKKAEKALLENEKRFRNLVWDLQVGVLLQGPKTEILLSNPKALELLGLSEDQLLGKTSFDPDWNTIHEDGSPFPGETHPVAVAIKDRRPVRNVIMGVYSPVRAGRVWLLIDAFPQLNSDGTVHQVVCSFNDISQRKMAEEALRRSEDLFNKAFHGSPTPMMITKQEDGEYLAVNDSFLEMTEYSREEVLGPTGREIQLVDLNERNKLRSELQKNNNLRDVEIMARSKSGKPLNLIMSVENTEIAGQKCSLTTMLDITSRKLSEAALLQSESKFRKIYEEGPFGMAMVSSNYKFIGVNNTFCQIVGYSENELLKLTFYDITLPEDITKDAEYIPKLINGEIPVYKTEKRYKKKDGSYVWVSLTATSNCSKDGEFLFNLAIIEDITNRKNTEAALIESRAFLNAALLNMTDAVFISNLQGEFIHINDAFATFHRFHTKEECSRFLAEYSDLLEVCFLDGKPTPVDMWAVPRALRGEVRTNEEHILRRKDTGESWIGSYSFSPIRDSNGEIFGSVVVGRDISDIKHAEEEILKLNTELESRVQLRTSQLEAANKELEAFSYSVSHDLRAPLRSISGFTQILLEEYSPKLDDEGKRLCNIIQDNTHNMGSLIDDLLAFSRLSRSSMQKSDIIMKDMVSKVFDELVDKVTRSRIDFSAGNLCNTKGDPIMMKQVWINLISNAVKYSSKKERAKISITCRKEGEYCEFCVKDNGVGFDMAFKDKLFGVFQRLHGQSEFEGTGVGLAIVQRIIHRHGGQVWAIAELDKGAEFYFSLPVLNDI